MTAINVVTDLTIEDEIAIITVNSPPVNALSAKVREGLFTAFDQAGALPAVAAIILICEGKTFIAGADIGEFGKPMTGPSIREVQDLMERAPKLVIAAMHGTVLGGGLEIALMAHYRLAVPSTKAGLPEVNIGLVPGAGGTQRLPRVVGVEKRWNSSPAVSTFLRPPRCRWDSSMRWSRRASFAKARSSSRGSHWPRGDR